MTEDSHFGISVLLPTRGRTTQLKRSIKSLLDNADDITKVEILFAFDSDDQKSYKYAEKSVFPLIDSAGGTYSAIEFAPIGYTRLNEYVNAMAHQSTGDWMMFWNDDAIMQTQSWDSIIQSYTGRFVLQAVDTHNKHPYSIFPIVPREWLQVIGTLSTHQLSDAWLSQIGWMLDIVKRIPVVVEHDRFDLTGNNEDATYKNRILLEGRVHDPRDFNHTSFRSLRIKEAITLYKHLEGKGYDMSYFKAVLEGKQNPWEKMLKADVNKHMMQFQLDASKIATASTLALQ